MLHLTPFSSSLTWLLSFLSSILSCFTLFPSFFPFLPLSFLYNYVQYLLRAFFPNILSFYLSFLLPDSLLFCSNFILSFLLFFFSVFFLPLYLLTASTPSGLHSNLSHLSLLLRLSHTPGRQTVTSHTLISLTCPITTICYTCSRLYILLLSISSVFDYWMLDYYLQVLSDFFFYFFIFGSGLYWRLLLLIVTFSCAVCLIAP